MTDTRIRKLENSKKVLIGTKYYYQRLFKKLRVNKFTPRIEIIDEDKKTSKGEVVVTKWKPLPNKKPVLSFIDTSEREHPKVIMEVMENCEVDGNIEDPVSFCQMLPLNNKNDNFTTINFKMNKEYLSEDSLLPDLIHLFNESRCPNLDFSKMNFKVMNDNVEDFNNFRPTPQN